MILLFHGSESDWCWLDTRVLLCCRLDHRQESIALKSRGGGFERLRGIGDVDVTLRGVAKVLWVGQDFSRFTEHLGDELTQPSWGIIWGTPGKSVTVHGQRHAQSPRLTLDLLQPQSPACICWRVHWPTPLSTSSTNATVGL